jgi:thioredoxin-like negative regulator of GroEL
MLMVRGVLGALLSVTLLGVGAAAPFGDAAWIACTKAPTRACVFDEAFKIARASPPSETPVWRVLSAYAAVDPSGALRLAPDVETYRNTLRPVEDNRASVDGALVEVYAKARKFPEAERVLARLKRTPGYGGYALVLATGIARAQSVTAAIARLRALGITQVSSRVFFSDLAPLAIARGEEAALLAFAREVDRSWIASNDKVAIWSYEPVVAIALAQLGAGRAQPAWTTVSHIPQYAARVSALGQIGAVLIDMGRVDEALAASLKIHSVVERNAVLFTMVNPPSVDMPLSRDPPRRPVRVAAAMQLAASLTGEGRDYAHALIARAFAESGALPQAWNAAHRIATPFSSYHALKSIGRAEAKAGDTRASLQTLARARAKAREQRHTLYDLIDLQISLGQFEAAKAAMREEAGKPQNVLKHKSAQTRLMEAYARAGRLEEAFQTPVDFMSDFQKTTRIARALAEGGFSKKAVATLSAARELGDEKELTLTAIVEERARAGALDDAALVLAAISPAQRHFALIAIAEAHAKAGNGGKALARIREALLLPPQADQYDGGLTFLLGAGSVLPK